MKYGLQKAPTRREPSRQHRFLFRFCKVLDKASYYEVFRRSFVGATIGRPCSESRRYVQRLPFVAGDSWIAPTEILNKMRWFIPINRRLWRTTDGRPYKRKTVAIWRCAIFLCRGAHCASVQGSIVIMYGCRLLQQILFVGGDVRDAPLKNVWRHSTAFWFFCVAYKKR